MCACREGSKGISVVIIVGADVACIDDDVSTAEVKLHDTENKEKQGEIILDLKPVTLGSVSD